MPLKVELVAKLIVDSGVGSGKIELCGNQSKNISLYRSVGGWE